MLVSKNVSVDIHCGPLDYKMLSGNDYIVKARIMQLVRLQA